MGHSVDPGISNVNPARGLVFSTLQAWPSVLTSPSSFPLFSYQSFREELLRQKLTGKGNIDKMSKGRVCWKLICQQR